MKIGIGLTLDEIMADELYAMLLLEEEQNKRENEKLTEQRNGIR